MDFDKGLVELLHVDGSGLQQGSRHFGQLATLSIAREHISYKPFNQKSHEIPCEIHPEMEKIRTNAFYHSIVSRPLPCRLYLCRRVFVSEFGSSFVYEHVGQ